MKIATIAFTTDRKNLFRELQSLFLKKNIETVLFQPEEEQGGIILYPEPDLVIMDSSNKGVQGLGLCQAIRKIYTGPLVLLCHPEEEQFSLLALQLGADFSLSSAASSHLIVENIVALLRRLTSTTVFTFRCDELLIDAEKREAFIAGRSTHLSTIEFQLLWLLCRKAGQVVTREAIHRELYKGTYNGYDRGIDLYISRIRQKIGDSPVVPKYLKTVRGIGYQFIGPLQNNVSDTNCYNKDTFVL